jgi:Protein of unknown function (DUF2808)
MKTIRWNGRLWRGLAPGLASGLVWAGVLVQGAEAVRFSDGTVAFAGLPQLLRVSTSENSVWAWGATYSFTLKVPQDASEPLGRIQLQQKEGVDTVSFNLKRTSAYLNGDRGQKIPLSSVEGEKDGEWIVNFETAIAPGNTVTLELRPYHNPDTGGVYLFGVTVFPQGEAVRSQFIGVGRLQFYDRSIWRHGLWRHPWGGWWR